MRIETDQLPAGGGYRKRDPLGVSIRKPVCEHVPQQCGRRDCRGRTGSAPPGFPAAPAARRRSAAVRRGAIAGDDDRGELAPEFASVRQYQPQRFARGNAFQQRIGFGKQMQVGEMQDRRHRDSITFGVSRRPLSRDSKAWRKGARQNDESSNVLTNRESAARFTPRSTDSADASPPTPATRNTPGFPARSVPGPP